MAEQLDPERSATVRKKLDERLSGLDSEISIDKNRLEQELIYYLEKADITEESVHPATGFPAGRSGENAARGAG